MTSRVSVIVPTYNEESVIHSTLEDLFSRHHPDQVIVVDGSSDDKTVSLASEWTEVISSPKGRAIQMNTGAEKATGDILLFLHADTRLPEKGLQSIETAIRQGAEAGRFRMRFDDRRWLLRFYESYTKFHFFSYGDQGFFVTKELFEKLGGFDEAVSFEDIDFYKRLRRVTTPIIIKDPVVTSARRFIGIGKLRQKFINMALVILYYAGLNVFNLKQKLYPEVR